MRLSEEALCRQDQLCLTQVVPWAAPSAKWRIPGVSRALSITYVLVYVKDSM